MRTGFFTLKFSFKLTKAIKVIAKPLVSGKGAMGAVSTATWSVMLGWQLGLIIVAILLLHEYGHVWMMKREGMKVRGIYMIPFMGAAAVPDEEFPTRRAEGLSALAGPVVGLTIAGVLAAGAYLTDLTVLKLAASVAAIVNTFNLFPILPLDGGRVWRSFSFSLSRRFGWLILSGGLGFGIWLLFGDILFEDMGGWGAWLFRAFFGLIIAMGVYEAVKEYDKGKSLAPMSWRMTFAVLAGWVIVFGASAALGGHVLIEHVIGVE